MAASVVYHSFSSGIGALPLANTLRHHRPTLLIGLIWLRIAHRTTAHRGDAAVMHGAMISSSANLLNFLGQPRWPQRHVADRLRPALRAGRLPRAIEVFDGNTAASKTLATQVAKLKQRFGLDHVVLIGDRGMITQARITEDPRASGLDWITALRAPAIKSL